MSLSSLTTPAPRPARTTPRPGSISTAEIKARIEAMFAPEPSHPTPVAR